MKGLSKVADVLFYVSLLGLILAAYGAFWGSDIWLAPTQWVLLSASAVVYALYIKKSR